MRFEVPTLIIGNLNAGGSGKTPHTEYFLEHFKEKRCAVISRGYGRKSSGFIWVDVSSETSLVGDEPLQIKRKFPIVPVAVCEDRVLAVPELLGEFPDTELILFDDAYQHRYLDAKVRVLLTAYSDLFTRDSLLPSGNLREAKREARRADFILVSKCPEKTDKTEQNRIITELSHYSQAPVFFSRFVYDEAQLVSGTFSDIHKQEAWKDHEVFVFSAIANGSTWADSYLKYFKSKAGELCYPDHHSFSKYDVRLFLKKWDSAGRPLVITTEKDWMRLKSFAQILEEVPIIYLPVRVKLLEKEAQFLQKLEEHLF